MHLALGLGSLHGVAKSRTQYPCLQEKLSIKQCVQQLVKQFGRGDFSMMLEKNKMLQ